jgi:hypothetical protein
MKLEYYREKNEKYPNIKFNENSSSGNRFVACRLADGQMDRQT